MAKPFISFLKIVMKTRKNCRKNGNVITTFNSLVQKTESNKGIQWRLFFLKINYKNHITLKKLNKGAELVPN